MLRLVQSISLKQQIIHGDLCFKFSVSTYYKTYIILYSIV